MPTGTVKWYDPVKGFGFVAPDEGGNDLFLHHSMVGSEVLAEGDRLSFSVGYGLKGERAEDIRVLERSGAAPRAGRGDGLEDRGFGGGRATGRNGGFGRQPASDPTTLPRLEGVVLRFDAERGFGFINSSEAPADVFFHLSEVAGSAVGPGDTVEFRLTEGARGPRARAVRLLGSASG